MNLGDMDMVNKFFSFQNENALNISLKKLVESKVYHQADIILVSQYFLHNLEIKMLAKFVDFFHKEKNYFDIPKYYLQRK